jgi:toxin FitB
MTTWLADTSVAVPLVQAAHAAHARVRKIVANRSVGLPAHSAVETYSVLTRLPGDARLSPSDAARLIEARFDRIAPLSPTLQRRLVRDFAAAGLAGGAVYDALIATIARSDNSTLLTRDSRTAATYAAIEADYELVV